MKESTGEIATNAAADKTTRELLATRNPMMQSALSRGKSGLNTKALERINKVNKEKQEQPNNEEEKVQEEKVQEEKVEEEIK